MMKVLCVAFLIACVFPYTQFLPIETYNQPYAALLGALIFAVDGHRSLRDIPRADALSLLGLAAVGILAFVATCLPIPNQQELKYLLIYISPLVLTLAAITCFREFPRTSLWVLSASAALWLAVGAIQVFIDPTFASGYVGVWQDAAEVVVESGRGVLGLAPEPTHHGFHLIVLAAIIVAMGGSRWLAWICIAAALLFARSSSAFLALLLGAMLFALLNPRLFRWPLLFACIAAAVAFFTINDDMIDNSRLLSLLSIFLEEPSAILQVDYSVNVRLGGLIASIRHCVESFFMPHGLSHEYWLTLSSEIVRQHSWLFDLSTSGPPSGFVIVVYQLGFVGLLLLYAPVRTVVTVPIADPAKIIVLAFLFVFLMQYLISTPSFSLLYAAVLSARCRSRVEAARLAEVSQQAAELPRGGVPA